MSFRRPWSLGNLNLVDYFPPESQDFYHEIVTRFENLPERSKLTLYIYVFAKPSK